MLAWTAPFSAAALAFGGLLVGRNAAAGVPWTSPAVFCGGPAAAFLIVAIAAAVLLFYILKFAAPSANRIVVHAGAAALIAGSLCGYHCIREFAVENQYRWMTGIGSGIAASIISIIIASGPARRIAGLFFTSLGITATLLFGAAVFMYNRSALVAAAENDDADPRDAVTNFPAMKELPRRREGAGRLFLLGIDGATWDKIDPLIAKGKLPNFALLKKDGATARLKTIVPTASPVIWTSIATGHTPLEHGIQDFVIRRARFVPSFSLELENRPLRALLSLCNLYGVAPVSSNLRTVKAIWNITSELKLKTCVIGWWATAPAESIDGWLISDSTSQEWVKRLTGKNEKLKSVHGATHPESLAAELAPFHRKASDVTKEELARFINMDDTSWSDFEKATTIDRDNPLSVLHSSYLRDEFYVTCALKINDEHKPDVVFSYTRLTDDLGHFFWEYSESEARELGKDPKLIERYKDTVDRGYEWADGIIGKFMSRLGPNDNLIVLSDHGWERASRGMYHHNNGPDGILAFYGAAAKRGYVLTEKPHVFDIGPTILYLIGLPKGSDMPGHALTEAFMLKDKETTIPTWETTRVGGMRVLNMIGSDEKLRELEETGYIGHRKK